MITYGFSDSGESKNRGCRAFFAIVGFDASDSMDLELVCNVT